MCVCVYVCVCVCQCICMFECVCVYLFVCVCMYVCITRFLILFGKCQYIDTWVPGVCRYQICQSVNILTQLYLREFTFFRKNSNGRLIFEPSQVF